MPKIIEVEGIGDVYAAKLGEVGLGSTDDLLSAGSTPAGRAELAERTGIAKALLLKWVNHADLFRISGIAGEYAELLEAAGVDTVPELAQRKPENLHARLVEVNGDKQLVRGLPGLSQVESWVEEARTLPRVVSY